MQAMTYTRTHKHRVRDGSGNDGRGETGCNKLNCVTTNDNNGNVTTDTNVTTNASTTLGDMSPLRRTQQR